jgi:hypothetical protein
MIKVDLYLNKKQQVYEFIKRKGRARTSEVAEFGIKIYHPDRACRDARQLAKEGKIGRLREDLKIRFYGNTKEDIWTIHKNEWDKKPNSWTNIPVTQNYAR